MALYNAAVIAFLVTAALLLVLRPLARRVGLVDRPGGRKTHSGAVPVVGGIGMFGGLLLAAVASGQLQQHGAVVLVAAALMVLVGALDDRFDLKPRFRLCAHAAAAMALVAGSGFVVPDLGNLLGLGALSLGWFELPFTVAACIALINAFNMLDGLDGLAGGCAMVAFVGLAVFALGAGAAMSAMMSLALVGACAGFLIFNIPALYNRSVRTFMGDAGSTLLGFLLAATALMLVQPERADIPPAFLLWMMPIPIFELFASTVRRVAKGLSPMQADDGHFHHRLLRAGFSVWLVFVIYLGVSAMSVAVGLAALAVGVLEPVMFGLFLLGFAAWLAFIRAAPVIGPALPAPLRLSPEAGLH